MSTQKKPPPKPLEKKSLGTTKAKLREGVKVQSGTSMKLSIRKRKFIFSA